MDKNLYGLLAEFDSATDLVDGANKIREAGYTKTDAFSPFPLHEIDEALGIKRSILPVLVFFGGITGLCLGVGLQVFVHYIDYPLNVGGRPYLSWPSFVPPSYELTILFTAFGSIFGMLLLNRLPKLYNPLFKSERFRRATHDGYFMLIETTDPKYSETETRTLLESTGSRHIEIVED